MGMGSFKCDCMQRRCPTAVLNKHDRRGPSPREAGGKAGKAEGAHAAAWVRAVRFNRWMSLSHRGDCLGGQGRVAAPK